MEASERLAQPSYLHHSTYTWVEIMLKKKNNANTSRVGSDEQEKHEISGTLVADISSAFQTDVNSSTDLCMVVTQCSMLIVALTCVWW